MAECSVLQLKKIIEIQDITIHEKKRGVTQKWIYENLIRDQYFISKATYDRYLARNAKKELRELEERT